ncbi:hypothetical protein ACT3RR_19710 [Ewingella sp. AOP8-B2-18]
MNNITRPKALLLFILFFGIAISCLLLGISRIRERISSSEVILVSKFDFVIPFASLVFFLVSVPAIYFFIKNRTMKNASLALLTKSIFISFITALVLGFLINSINVNYLEKKGYVQCKGIPTGWTPGTATEYALNEGLCK